MASFYSKPADYGTYTQAINLDLVNFVMQSKQQKYDYNLEKAQSKVRDQLGNLDLERAQDKEYFLGRAEQTLASIGDLSKLDWSKNGVSRNVDAQLNSVVDDRVLNDVVSTRNYRSFQNTLREKQENNDGTYSSVNAAYAMDRFGVSDWLNGDSDSIGTVQYQDFTDVGAELKEISENLDQYARVFKRQTPSGDGRYWVTEEGKQLSAQEVRAIAESQLSDKAKGQMRINGWANYDGGVRSTAEISTDFNNFKKGKVRNIDQTIANLNTKIKNLAGTNSPLLAQYTEQRNKQLNYKDQLVGTYDSWLNSGAVDNMTTTMENERVLEAFGNTFSINNMESSLTENKYALAEFRETLERETQAQKISLQAAAKAKQKGQDEDGNPFQTITPTATRDGRDYTEVNRYDETVKDVANYDQTYKQKVRQVLNSISDPDIVESLKSGYNPDSGISEEAYIESRMQQLGADSSKYIKPNQLRQIEESRLRRDRAIEIKAEAEDYAMTVLESAGSSGNNLDNIVEEYADNKNILLLDENGKATNARDLFDKFGIQTGEDLNNNPKVKDLVLKSYYADRIIFSQSDGGGFDGLRLRIAEGLRGLGIKSFGSTEEENNAHIEAIKESIEVDANVDIYKDRLIKMFGGDEKKALEFIAEASDRGIGIRKRKLMPTTNTDDSVMQDNSLESWISPEEVAREAGKRIAETGVSTRQDAVVLNGDTPMANDLTNILRSSRAMIDGNIQAKIKEGMSYTLEDVGDGTVLVTFNIEREGQTEVQSARLPIANLPASINNTVNFNQSTPLFTEQNMKEVTAPVKFVESTDTNRLKGIADMWGVTKGQAADFVSREGLETTIARSFGSLVGTAAQPTAIGSALNNMMDSGDLVAKIVEVDGEFYNQISFIDPVSNVETVLHVSSNNIAPSELETSYFNTKYAPQLSIYEATLNGLAQTQLSGAQNPAPFIKKIMEIYGR